MKYLLISFLFFSCCPARDINGRCWPAWDVFHRAFAKRSVKADSDYFVLYYKKENRYITGYYDTLWKVPVFLVYRDMSLYGEESGIGIGFNFSDAARLRTMSQAVKFIHKRAEECSKIAKHEQ